MTLKQLEALYWASALGSFALAAERLCMTQSSLSKRILELEEELGERLFDRSGPRARVTDMGLRVAGQAQQMLGLRDEILMTARGVHGLQGTCRFGVSELVALTWLPALVAVTRESYPLVALEPRMAVAQELIDDLLRGNTDFALGPGSSPDAEIESRHLADVEMVWMYAPRYLSRDTILTAESLDQYPVISMSAHSGVTSVLDAWAVRTSLKFRRIVASNSMGAVAALAAAGLGICLLPSPYAIEFIDKGRLCRLRVTADLEPPRLSYYLHWRRSSNDTLSRVIREIALTVGQSPIQPPYASVA